MVIEPLVVSKLQILARIKHGIGFHELLIHFNFLSCSRITAATALLRVDFEEWLTTFEITLVSSSNDSLSSKWCVDCMTSFLLKSLEHLLSKFLRSDRMINNVSISSEFKCFIFDKLSYFFLLDNLHIY